MVNCPKGCQGWVEACLQQTKRWRCPPNWSQKDWEEELWAVAYAAAWEASDSYDPSQNASLEAFVKGRVQTAILQRYREEWRYTTRCCSFPYPSSEDDEPSEIREIYDIPDFTDTERFWQKLEARDLLRRLSPTERHIIERCIMDGMSETEVATELGISQQTVSRWKQKALEKLQRLIRGEKVE